MRSDTTAEPRCRTRPFHDTVGANPGRVTRKNMKEINILRASPGSFPGITPAHGAAGGSWEITVYRITIALLVASLGLACSDSTEPVGDLDVHGPRPERPVVIQWSTEVPMTGVVELGTTAGEYDMYAYAAGEKFRTEHQVTLFGLDAGKTYYYRARSMAVGGEVLNSFEKSFVAPDLDSEPETLTMSVIDISNDSPGDAILLEAPGANVIMDAGGTEAINTVRNYVWNRGVQYIDFAMVSHDHWDHAGGLAGGLAADLDVQAVVIPWSNYRENYIDTLRSYTTTYGLPLYEAQRGDDTSNAEYLFWGYGVNVEMISAGAGNELEVGFEGTDINNDSLVMKVTFGDASFMLTGDAENEVNNTYVLNDSDAYDVDIDVLKVGHHGRRDANSLALVQETSPQLAVISTHNDGLLQPEVIWDLNSERTDTFRIDLPSPNLNRIDPDANRPGADLFVVTDGSTILVSY